MRRLIAPGAVFFWGLVCLASGAAHPAMRAPETSVKPDFDALEARAEALTAESIPGLQNRAEAGEAESQLMVGFAYYKGKVVKKDYAQAFRWLSNSAEQGNACAQAQLGYMYQFGLGIARDINAAVKWYRAGAGLGCARAEGRLGRLYIDGEGVPRDREEGLRRMRRAAEQGDSRSQTEMGDEAEEAKDYAEAAKWYRLAADKDALAAYHMGSLYERGLGFPKDLTEALSWYRKAATKDFYAQFKVGEMYRLGQGVPRDRTEAMKWYRKAADNGHTLSKFIAATHYEPTGYETVTVGSGFQARGSGVCKWHTIKPNTVDFETGVRWSGLSDAITITFSIEDSYSDPQELTRDVPYTTMGPLQYQRLSDGTEVWWRTGTMLRIGPLQPRHFRGIARRSGTLYSAKSGYNSAGEDSRILDCFLAITPTLGRASAVAQLTDPVYGDHIDFLGEWSHGDLSRSGGVFKSLGKRSWIFAGRLNGYATDVESAMAMIEAEVEQRGAKLGARQSLSMTGLQALWSEVPGSGVPFYGAVARGGRFYYVYMENPYNREMTPEDRQGFFSTLQSIRP